MGWLFVLGGAGLILAGLYNVFNPDKAWAAQESANAWRGIASERTDTWEFSTILRSVAAILVGIVLIFMGLGEANRPSPASATATMQANMNAYATTYVEQMSPHTATLDVTVAPTIQP